MSSLARRIERLNEALDEFFESERWERWTRNVVRLSFVLFLLLTVVNADSIVAVLRGVPS